MISGKSVSLIGLLLLMEILPGFAVAVGSDLLDSTNVPYSVFWLLLLCGAMGVGVAQAVSVIKLKDPWDRLVMIVAGVVALGMAAWLLPHRWNTNIAGLPLCGLAYWRGLVWVDRSAELDDVQHQFGVGFAGVFLGIIWVIARGVTSEGSIWQVLALTGIAYTATALVALTVGRTERGSAAGASVALAVGTSVGVLVLLGLGALSFFSFDIAGWLGGVTRPFWDLIGLVLGSVIRVLVSPLVWLSEVLHHNTHTRQHISGLRPPRVQRHKPLITGRTHASWIRWVLAAMALAGVVVIARLLWNAVPRLQRRQEEEQEESAGTAHAQAPFWQALITWLRGLFRSEKLPLTRSVAAARRRLLGPTYPSDPVRRLYAQMLHRAETQGLPRAVAATPQEFCRRLEGRWPAASSDFATMTEAYVLRRYGDMTVGDDQIQTLKQHWKRARIAMKESSVLNASSD
ncbi:MAG TPA: DUF4129 domain-containing protein [Anaerolineales bacterium]